MQTATDSRPAPTLPAALQGLLHAAAYPHPVARVELLATHMSWVLLTGEYAYKIKRPVRFAFADFTDPAHRAALCAEEIRLNRRFAPTLYLGVVPVTLDDGVARIGGTGPTIETAVRMRQFDRRDELDARVRAGTVGSAEFAAFGAELAAIHAALPRLPPATVPAAATARVLRRNYAELQRLAAAPRQRGDGPGPSEGQAQDKHSSPSMVAANVAPLGLLRHSLARALRAARPALEARQATGAIRECHGDLHLSNLVLLGGRITAFDALEFEPAFRRIDVADEVAFLCADLAGHGAPALAQAFLGAYLEASGDYDLLRVLDLYVAHRALVRAKIMALRATDAQRGAPDAVLSTHRGGPDAALTARRDAYVAVASRALRPPHQGPRPRLLLLHGLSGSGKTWLARQLAPRLEAIHLRSDVERKRLGGLAPLASSESAPGAGLYAASQSALTYERLAQLARTVLDSGRSVVCDAAFLTRAARDTLRAAARPGTARVTIVHCSAPDTELRRRLRARRAAADDASEADEAVLEWQLRHAEPLQQDERLDLVEVDTAGADPVGAALRALDAPRPATAEAGVQAGGASP